jgi:hypothetical protein
MHEPHPFSWSHHKFSYQFPHKKMLTSLKRNNVQKSSEAQYSESDRAPCLDGRTKIAGEADGAVA